jgi:hypothetical protein
MKVRSMHQSSEGLQCMGGRDRGASIQTPWGGSEADQE